MPRLVFAHATAASPWAQLTCVLGRASVSQWRAAHELWVRLVVLTYLGLLFGLLFIDVDLATYAGVQSGLGFILAACAWCGLIFFTSGITRLFLARRVFYRERAAGFYHPEVHSTSALVVELPYMLPLVLLNVSLSYWLAGLRPTAAAFFFFVAGAALLSTFWLAAAVAYSALFPTVEAAQLVGGLTISTTFLMAGLFIPVRLIPPFWQGLYYAVPTSHVLRALGADQFFCAGGAAAGCPAIVVVSAGGEATVDRYAYVVGVLGSGHADRWGELGWVALSAGVLALVAVGALRCVNHERR
jgi:hypothetical protein